MRLIGLQFYLRFVLLLSSPIIVIFSCLLDFRDLVAAMKFLAVAAEGPRLVIKFVVGRFRLY